MQKPHLNASEVILPSGDRSTDRWVIICRLPLSADVLDMDPYEKIKGATCPVLIVHGTADKIVHPDYTRRTE